jgi:hypothetical protein
MPGSDSRLRSRESLSRRGSQLTVCRRPTEVPCHPFSKTAIWPTRFENELVPPTTEPLREDGLHIVASIREKARRSGTQILVELESHAALLPGKSTYRSRLISAP